MALRIDKKQEYLYIVKSDYQSKIKLENANKTLDLKKDCIFLCHCETAKTFDTKCAWLNSPFCYVPQKTL